MTESEFRNENRNSYTSLVVSVDRFKTSHNSLQYNVDRFAVVKPDGKVQFRHNGQMGNHKNEQVVNDVSICGPPVRLQVKLVKNLPVITGMKTWCRQQKKEWLKRYRRNFYV